MYYNSFGTKGYILIQNYNHTYEQHTISHNITAHHIKQDDVTPKSVVRMKVFQLLHKSRLQMETFQIFAAFSNNEEALIRAPKT